MERVKLIDICKPKQWKTISGKDILEKGKYPVYGANGKIGFYNEYNHEKPTLLIGCRGHVAQYIFLNLLVTLQEMQWH